MDNAEAPRRPTRRGFGRNAWAWAWGAAIGPAWAPDVQAMFAALSDDALIARSDLVVMGTWAGPVESLPGQGRVDVAEVLKGPPGLKSVAVAIPVPGAPISSSDLPRRTGDRGLWLLVRRDGDPEGLHRADHPQRFVPAADTARIEVLRGRLAAR